MSSIHKKAVSHLKERNCSFRCNSLRSIAAVRSVTYTEEAVSHVKERKTNKSCLRGKGSSVIYKTEHQ